MTATSPRGWAPPAGSPAVAGLVSGRRRLDAGALRLAGVVMLAVAVVRPWLPHGLGLPCPLRTLTGVPCPLCGMTRAVTYAVHGDLGASLAMTPAGIAAVVLALGLLAAWRVRRVSVPAWAVPAILGLMWAYQLAKYATGRTL